MAQVCHWGDLPFPPALVLRQLGCYLSHKSKHRLECTLDLGGGQAHALELGALSLDPRAQTSERLLGVPVLGLRADHTPSSLISWMMPLRRNSRVCRNHVAAVTTPPGSRSKAWP